MWLGCILCRGNEVYHLAVGPSSHAVRKPECVRHPAAPAEALAFARLEDESVSSLLRNRVTFSHPNITAIHFILYQKHESLFIYLLWQYALRNLPEYTNHIKQIYCNFNLQYNL